MPEIRRDPITGRNVIIAPERSARPNELASEHEQPGEVCPFCPGHESTTPPEVFAIRHHGGPANGPGWQVRVVPNRYPAVTSSPVHQAAAEGFFSSIPAFGQHDVIIETPDHDAQLHMFPVEQVTDVLIAWRARLRTLAETKEIAAAVIFKNCGQAAGASLSHSHSQLIATSFIPSRLKEQLTASAAHFDARSRCIYCEMIERETNARLRVVAETDHNVVLSPFASRSPYGVLLLPKRHSSRFDAASDAELARVAGMTRDVLSRLHAVLPGLAYNMVLHSAPFHEDVEDHYHWSVEILPRVSNIAGYELGAGNDINIVSPEQAAAELRSAVAD